MEALWSIIKSFWWLWALLLVTIPFEYLIDWLIKWLGQLLDKRWLEKHKKLEDWRKLKGTEFERVVATIYRNLGYKAKINRPDRGIDVIAYQDSKRFFIQCKQMERVDPGLIREFYGSVIDRIKEGDRALFITTGVFTKGGYDFIKDKPIFNQFEFIEGLKLEGLANQQK